MIIQLDDEYRLVWDGYQYILEMFYPSALIEFGLHKGKYSEARWKSLNKHSPNLGYMLHVYAHMKWHKGGKNYSSLEEAVKDFENITKDLRVKLDELLEIKFSNIEKLDQKVRNT